MSNQSTPFVSSTGESRNPFYEGQFDGETPEQAAARLHWARVATETAALKAGQGEAVAIAECREVHGHMCQFLNRTQHGMDTLRDGDKLYTTPPASADAVSVVLFKTLSDAVSELSSLNSYAREVANEDDDEESQEVCDSTDESIEHMQAVLNKYRALLAQSQEVKS